MQKRFRKSMVWISLTEKKEGRRANQTNSFFRPVPALAHIANHDARPFPSSSSLVTAKDD
jgi:hypothetical protein